MQIRNVIHSAEVKCKHSLSRVCCRDLSAVSQTPSNNTPMPHLASPSSSAFSPFGVGASCFQSFPRSPVLWFSLYSFLLHVFSNNITPSQFWSSYLSVSTHFHLPCSHYYILFSLFLHMDGPTISVSRIFSLTFATPAIALIFHADLLNPLYSHHPSEQKHVL